MQQVFDGLIGGVGVVLNVDLVQADDLFLVAGLDIMRVGGAAGEKSRTDGGDEREENFNFHIYFSGW